jgi:hypothetical protein
LKAEFGLRLAVDHCRLAVDLGPVQGARDAAVDDQQRLVAAPDHLVAFARRADDHADLAGPARDQLHPLPRRGVVSRQQLLQPGSCSLSNGDHLDLLWLRP